MKTNFTGERLLTSVYNENAIKHLHRYALTLGLITDKIVLDIASGEGYGSFLMKNRAKFVYGVDIDRETVAKANEKYKKKNLQFINGSTSSIPLESNSVDVVVSFETLEHHDEHEQMLKEIKRVLKKDGILLISTPDKYFYSDLREYKNPFHVKELYKQQFIDLISANFINYQLFSQSYLHGNSIIIEDRRRENFDFFTGDFLKLGMTTSPPQFLMAYCSNAELMDLNDSIFDGKYISESIMKSRINIVYNSKRYKLGNFILSPITILRNTFRTRIKSLL